MGRPLRNDIAGGWYHVMNRGADHQPVFRSRADGERFESLIGAASFRHRVEVHAYCFMPNHFHVLVHCPDGGLSAFVHAITAPYSRMFNARIGRDGPLFRSRFRALAVATPAYQMAAGRYIHRNPIDLAPERPLADYPWSSYASYLGERPAQPWLVTRTLLGHVSGTDAYRALVDGANGFDLLEVAGLRGLIELIIDEVTDARGGERRALTRTVMIALLDDCGPRLAADLGRALGVDARRSASPARVGAHARIAADPRLQMLVRRARAAAGSTVPGTTRSSDAIRRN